MCIYTLDRDTFEVKTYDQRKKHTIKGIQSIVLQFLSIFCYLVVTSSKMILELKYVFS